MPETLYLFLFINVSWPELFIPIHTIVPWEWYGHGHCHQVHVSSKEIIIKSMHMGNIYYTR